MRFIINHFWAFAYTTNVYERKNAMKFKIAVAFGGESVEHEISILSAQQAMYALDPKKYEVIPLYIAKDGRMYTHSSFMDIDTFRAPHSVVEMMENVTIIRREQKYFIIPCFHHIIRKEIEIDMVFPILHGTHGEDGSFQGFLSSLKIPYVGPRVLGGAIGQDKVIMKQILQDSGLPLTPWFYWTRKQPLEEAFFKKAQRLGYPLVIKPANLGSSIGICVVHNDVELHKAMIEAYQYDTKVVIEKAVEHLREINCSLIGDDEECMTSVLEEVVKQDDILSYMDKYQGKKMSKGIINSKRSIPADVEEDIGEEIRTYAKQVFQVLNASGVVRIDFLMEDVHKELYVNEINTIPGSLSFYLWEKSGMSFPELMDKLIQLGRKQHRKEKKLVYSYNTNILQNYQGGDSLTK